MASFIGSDKELSCSICAGHYQVPRKLPGCIHSFCEKCILKLIQTLKNDDVLGTTFECPVCRLPSKSPEEDNITIDWVQSLDNDTELESKVEKQDECNAEWCSQCRYTDKFIKTKFYCSACKDYFCETCSKALHSFKINEGHPVIEIKDDADNGNVREQAVQLLKKYLTCDNHPDNRVEFYCEDENVFYCVKCAVTEHHRCTNVKTVQEITKKDDNAENVVQSSAGLLGSLSTLSNHIQAIIALVREKDTESKALPGILATEFQEMKQKVIKILDAAEESIMQESKSGIKDISIKSLDEIQELNNISSDVIVVSCLLNDLMGNLPPEHATICCHEARKTFQVLERKFIERGPTFETEQILLKTKDVFHRIVQLGLNETEKIVSVDRAKKTFHLPRYNGKFLLRSGKIEIVDEKECIPPNCPGSDFYYVGMIFLPDNRLILTDSHYGICTLLDTNSEPVDSVHFAGDKEPQGSLIDANFTYPTLLANGIVAVSVSNEKKICFFSADEKLEKKGEIVCEFTPSAIHGLQNGDIAVVWTFPVAFGIISLCGGSYKNRVYFDKDNTGKALNNTRRMAIDEYRRHVVLPSIKDQTVSCYDYNGNRIFLLKNIKGPRGLTIDNNGTIYLCDNNLGQIHLISPEGDLIRKIQDNCPRHPIEIGFSKCGNRFAVSQWTPQPQKIIFFDISAA